VGGARLAGTVRVAGAKNSALKLMAATLLAPGRSVIEAVPAILDVTFMADLLRRLGADVAIEGARVTIDVPQQVGDQAEYGLVRRLRASINVLGPLVARCGQASVALPGGDNIGSRGLDLHVMGLERLGATVSVEHGNVVARAPHGLRGTEIELDFPSVGATENLLMAGVLARGTTVIDNAAREPEITDICEFLSGMGAKIEGAGSSRLVIEGVDSLSPTEHTTVPDRLVVGTWAIGAVMTRGDVLVDNAKAGHMEIVLDKLAATGADVTAGAAGVRVRMETRPRAVDVVTLPYPGFPTDLQALMVSLLAISEGTAMVSENLYEARFMYVNELSRLGARIRTDGHHAVVRGQERLSGAPVVASDIRAGAGLVLAGLVADGVTTVGGVHHIDRGYPDIVGTLRALGATADRETDPDVF
jgi:UDP-N-acetylglucosamine 1-carboxyvinyltransferase